LFIRADNDDDVGDFGDKQTNTYSVGFPLTFKNYNLFEAREARDEIIL